MLSSRIHHGRKFQRCPGRMYSEGHVDIFDMVDINLFTVISLKMMIVQLGYLGKSDPLFNYYLRPLTSLDEGLYALACEDDVRCLATLDRSLKLIEVYIEHGVTSEKMLLFTWHDSSEPTTELVCDSVTAKSLSRHDSVTPKSFIYESLIARCMPHCMLISPIGGSSITYRELSGVERVDTKDHETKLDGEAGFSDVAGSGIENFGLSHDESFGVDDLNLNLNEHVGLNRLTQEPIVAEVRTHEPNVEEGIGQEDESAPSDGQFFYDVEGIYIAYKTKYEGQSSEHAGKDDDDDEDDYFLVDEKNKIVKPDVDVHLFGISMDGEKEETAFQTLKQKLCSAPILAFPEGSENFIVYCDASHKGLGDSVDAEGENS
ncbi:ribosomal RNA small subunit methyltransferase [Tanacetum coccineum]